MGRGSQLHTAVPIHFTPADGNGGLDYLQEIGEASLSLPISGTWGVKMLSCAVRLDCLTSFSGGWLLSSVPSAAVERVSSRASCVFTSACCIHSFSEVQAWVLMSKLYPDFYPSFSSSNYRRLSQPNRPEVQSPWKNYIYLQTWIWI